MRNRIEEYIKSGEKSENTVGIELEHFVVDKNSGKNIPYSGKGGVREILEEISHCFGQKIYSEGFLIGLSNDEYILTLEPAAQLEISIKPVEMIGEAERIYGDFLKIISPPLEKRGYMLLTEGYRHNCRAEELELIPKMRYKFMDKYFEKTGKYGKNMMRATAAAQISIDYSDEEDCALKFRVANILSPIFAFICDNSTVFENEPYGGRMLRTVIWDGVDPVRCGIVPCAAELTYEKYSEYVLNRPPILIMKDREAVYTGDKKTADIYRDGMLYTEAEHLLSMFFPSVRLKRYIEIRSADSMPIEKTLAYAALVKGIFKEPAAFDFEGVTVSDMENAGKALIRDGFNAAVYGIGAYELYVKMIECAREGLSAEERVYLNEWKYDNVRVK